MASATLPTRSSFRNLTGMTFGRLTVLEFAGMKQPGRDNLAYWSCHAGTVAEEVTLTKGR